MLPAVLFPRIVLLRVLFLGRLAGVTLFQVFPAGDLRLAVRRLGILLLGVQLLRVPFLRDGLPSDTCLGLILLGDGLRLDHPGIGERADAAGGQTRTHIPHAFAHAGRPHGVMAAVGEVVLLAGELDPEADGKGVMA